MDEAVDAALEAAFPTSEVASVDDPGPSWNETNETVRVAFADGDATYLKVAVDGDDGKVVRERAVAGFVRANCDVRAPAVLACAPDHDPPYLATAPLSGRPVHEVYAEADAAGRVDLLRKVGRALAAVHAEPFDGHGLVVGGGADGLDVDPAPWTDVLLDVVDGMRERAVTERFDGYFEDVVAAVEANRDLLDDAPVALLHGDPGGPNSVLADGEVGFVDWEVARVGDPAWELFRARDQQFDSTRGGTPEQQLAAFHDGYREVAGALPDGFEVRRPVYEAVWFLSRVGFFDNYVELVDAPESELAEYTRREMERRLDVIR